MSQDKYEIVKMAREAGLWVTGFPTEHIEHFAALCRAPLVAENEGLKESLESVLSQLKERDAELEQTRVQLAGCGVAAMQNTKGSNLFTHDQLLAYGAAQRLAGRERAIEECAAECLALHANGNYKHDTREDCHDAIRALAASPQEQT